MPKKLFIVGDFRSNTGPGIANKALKNAFGNRAFCSAARTRFGRILELIFKIPFCDAVCFCGFSVLNVHGIKIARFFNKKTAYLMHGYVEYEGKINHSILSSKRLNAEHYILENVDELICVSKLLADKVLEKYPNRKNIEVVYDIVNPVDIRKCKKDHLLIFSTGGDMPRKNNLKVCEAIKNINVKLSADKQLKYIIAGNLCGSEKDFEKYDFVKLLGNISYEESLELMEKADLYIQNSLFETFGLAVVEAISCGCNIIVSSEVGALEVIDGDRRKFVIDNPNNVDEIENKISNFLSGDFDNSRSKVDWEKVSGDSVTHRILDILGVAYEK